MQEVLHNPLELPDDLPAPVDDGAARHLTGLALPDVELRATDGARSGVSPADPEHVHPGERMRMLHF